MFRTVKVKTSPAGPSKCKSLDCRAKKLLSDRPSHRSRCLEAEASTSFVLEERTVYKRQCLRLSALAFAESKAQHEVASFSHSSEGDSDSEVEGSRGLASQEGFCVVNFYHLTDLDKPHAAVARHRAWLQDRNIQGRIYISSQGINAQLSGPETDARAYAAWVSEQDGFQVDLFT